LRDFLKKQLPEYMVPSTFFLLDRLPLTESGKVDRGELPSPDHARPETSETYVAPRTSIEERLVKAWSEVLGLARIGVHDNFFNDLGGHSLLATRLVSRIRDSFGMDLPLRTIFDLPTIAGLAQAIESFRSRGEEREEPSITRLSREQHRMIVSQPGRLSPTEVLNLKTGNRLGKAVLPDPNAKVVINRIE
jgi:acyl carrier protein